MKRIICLLLILAVLFTVPVSISADSNLENLQAPIVEHLKGHTDQLSGRSIWNMTMYNGKLYIGWGDYGTNLGQLLGDGIPLLCYTNETNVWEHAATLDDEEIIRFFEYKNKLYITGTDPIKRVGSVYVGDKDGMWTIMKTYDGGTHVFDMLINNDTMYVSYGPASNTPIIRYSTDLGTFNDIQFKYDGKTVMGSSRTYNLFEYKGEIYATLKISSSSGKYSGLYKLDKENMVLNYVAKGNNRLIEFSSPAFDAEINGYFVYVNKTATYTDNIEDDNSWKTVPGVEGTVTCTKRIGDELYFSAYTQNDNGKYISKLYKTKDLKKVEVVYTFEYDAYIQSFCNENDIIYFGTGGKNEASGRVFSLSPVKYGKTDITVDVYADSDDDNPKPKWLRYQLKAGDKIIKEGILNDSRGWEFTIKGVDARNDWNVVVTGDSVGYEWEVKKVNDTFELTNKLMKKADASQSGNNDSTSSSQDSDGTTVNEQENEKENNILIIVLCVLGGVLLVGGAVVAVIFIVKQKRKKQNNTADQTEETIEQTEE